jgi:hypothetical protein
MASMTDRRAPEMGRRAFLVGTGVTVGAAALGACGGGSGDSTPDGLVIVQRFPQDVSAVGPVRLPVSLAADGALLDGTSDWSPPDPMRVSLTSVASGLTVASAVEVARHGEGLAAPYWPVRLVVDEPGFYVLTIDGLDAEGAALEIRERDRVLVPVPGDPLPPFDTPTLDDSRGVEPICTRAEGPCPFHDVTLTEALGEGRPVVYLIGTPAFCKTGTCSPALEALITVASEVGGAARFVHADVYTDSTATTVAPALVRYSMTYEPALFVTDSSGTLVERLDAVFDVVEMRDVLSRAGIS